MFWPCQQLRVFEYKLIGSEWLRVVSLVAAMNVAHQLLGFTPLHSTADTELLLFSQLLATIMTQKETQEEDKGNE